MPSPPVRPSDGPSCSASSHEAASTPTRPPAVVTVVTVVTAEAVRGLTTATHGVSTPLGGIPELETRGAPTARAHAHGTCPCPRHVPRPCPRHVPMPTARAHAHSKCPCSRHVDATSGGGAHLKPQQLERREAQQLLRESIRAARLMQQSVERRCAIRGAINAAATGELAWSRSVVRRGGRVWQP